MNKINLVTKTKIVSSLLLAFIFVAFNQCVIDEMQVTKVETPPLQNEMPKDEIHGGGSAVGDVVGGGNSASQVEFSEQGATVVARTSSLVGIKDFEQIHRTMSVVTGINPQDHNAIRNAYSDLSTQLPSANDVKQFSSSIQLAIFKLGSEYCDEMVDNGTYRNAVFVSINLGQSPNQVLNNDTGKLNLINDILNRFWGNNVQDAAVLANARTELLALTNQLLQGENRGSANTTRDVAKGVCASVIGTPQITML